MIESFQLTSDITTPMLEEENYVNSTWTPSLINKTSTIYYTNKTSVNISNIKTMVK